MNKKKWKWRPTRQNLINLTVLVVSFIVVVLLIVLGIRGLVGKIQETTQTKRIVRELKEKLDSASEEDLGLTGYVVKCCRESIPSVLSELSWVFEHSDLYPKGEVKAAKKNPELIHFLYMLGNEFYVTDQPIKYTAEEMSAKPPYFQQWDERWGFDAYGDGLIGIDGCGPTALAMVVSGLTNSMVSPRDIANFSVTYGYYVAESGSAWAMVPGGCDYYDLSCYDLMLDEYAMQYALDEGGLIIAVVGPGHFTSEGHFLVIYGYDESGFLIYDPNNLANSKITWAYETIKGEIQALWQIYG